MKVKIGKYKDYIGPYQIARALCFWVPSVVDSDGTKSKPDWVYRFGNWLSKNRKGEKSWLLKLCTWIEKKRRQKVYVKIDPWDTWSLDYTLALIATPMLKQLRETKKGAPFTDDADVPEFLRRSDDSSQENFHHIDSKHFRRWDWILNEMIFSFETITDEEWEHKHFKNGKWDFNSLNLERERVSNGFRLFGKYYQNLWD